jgi:hypothetical protein
MADAFSAMAISGGILLVVLVLIVAITVAVVDRGEAGMREHSKRDSGH